MVLLVRRTFVACCLVLVAGCVTDEPTVYKDSIVGKDAVKAFVGEYQVEEWPGNAKPESVSVAQKEGELSFSYSVPDKKYDVHFVLCKIPNSKQDLYLLSIPSQEATNQANLFFIGKTEKKETHIWAVFAKLPVANDHLSFQNGKAKAEDVKTFLSKHADAFVQANEPQVRLKKGNG